MTQEGPVLERLTHRLSECPADFLAEPRMGRRGEAHVDAVVNDLLAELGGPGLDPEDAKVFQTEEKKRRNHLRLCLVAAWLFHDEWFRGRGREAKKVYKFLSEGLVELAGLVAADQFVNDADRREELARLGLSALSLRPAGETEAQARDRLETLSSVVRAGVISATKEKQERARKLRQAMEEKRARESAAKYSRE